MSQGTEGTVRGKFPGQFPLSTAGALPWEPSEPVQNTHPRRPQPGKAAGSSHDNLCQSLVEHPTGGVFGHLIPRRFQAALWVGKVGEVVALGSQAGGH